MYFWTYGLRKTWLDKCLKCPISDHPLTSSMVNGPKHCSKLNDSIFTIFIDPCEHNWGWKSLSEWYAESQDCLLNYWLPVISMLFLIETIFSNIFKSNYLRKKKYFQFFFCSFLNLDLIFNIFKKRWLSHLMYFWTYGLRKKLFFKCLKNTVSEMPLTSNMVNGPKHCSKLNESKFAVFIDPYECN